MIIAITGRSGSGKSYVAAHYASLGYTVIDADIVAHEVLKSDKALQQELIEVFGEDIIDSDGTLLRKKLANRAFLDEESAKALTRLTHPRIVKRILELASASKSEHVFVDGAVIIGALFEQHCDKFIVITAPHQDAIARISIRDGISRTAAENRLAAQMSEKELIERANYVIINNTGKEALLANAERILHAIANE